MLSSDIGVAYTVQGVSPNTLSVADLDTLHIEYIRIQWTDLVNTVRCRVVTLSHFKKLLQTSRPGVTMVSVALLAVLDTLPPGYEPIGERLLAVDLCTLRVCPYAPGHAVVLGFFEEKVPFSTNGDLSVEVPYCPRTLLRRVIRDAKEKHGVEFLVGFESEFILLESTRPVKSITDGTWSEASSYNAGTLGQKVLDEIASQIRASGIELQMYHSEMAPGQHEIVTGPLPPLEAADALIHTRQIIVNVASKHGLRATFAPRVYANNSGTACHAHISVHASGTVQPSQSSFPLLNTLESSFLAGLLTHLPAVSAFTLPQPASYARVKDGLWSGGTWVAWGVDNKELPVRLCNASSPPSRNFEVKCIDGLANPYYALAAVLGAGVTGVIKGEEVHMKDCSKDKQPSQMSDAERTEIGAKDRMALTWEEAISKLEENTPIQDILGREVVKMYLTVNKLLPSVLGRGTKEEGDARLIENY